MAWIRRRRERKAARQAARLLVALDQIAGVHRVRYRRVARASLSAAR